MGDFLTKAKEMYMCRWYLKPKGPYTNKWAESHLSFCVLIYTHCEPTRELVKCFCFQFQKIKTLAATVSVFMKYHMCDILFKLYFFV